MKDNIPDIDSKIWNKPCDRSNYMNKQFIEVDLHMKLQDSKIGKNTSN